MNVVPSLTTTNRGAASLKQPERESASASARVLLLPLALTFALIAVGLLPGIRQQPALRWSIWGAGLALMAANLLLATMVHRSGRRLAIEVNLRKQHYIQACAHLSILAYWGWYWRQVYEDAPLILAQLVFAYALDTLLTWSRRDTYTLGFGPFPIIFSTNLFLWFKRDWFYLQFLLVATGFAAKELIRWDKDGRRVHIFNPSSFPLALFSVILLLTGRTWMTWGPEIAATQFNPPHIYLWIFLAALPGQLLFGVASMTLAAVTTLYGFCLAYWLATGTQYFLELPIPIAVFLGMHLLFTDPSTSPRTELGRLVFGVLYGAMVLGLFALLDRFGLPSFYDKLLPVPLLNLTIQGLDRAARSDALKRFDPTALGRALRPRARNLAYVAVWAVVFVTMQLITGDRAVLARGDSLKGQGRLDEAIAQYQEFVRSEPGDFDGQHKLGAALLETGRPSDAVGPLEKALAVRPNNAPAQYGLGYALLQLGRFEQARDHFTLSLQFDPSFASAQYALGLALWADGSHDDAIATFREAVRRWPGSAEAHYNLGAVLERNGEIDEAARSYAKATDINPAYADANFALGLIHARRGEVVEAMSRFHRVLDAKPHWIPAEVQVAWLLATSSNTSINNPGAAIDMAEQLAARTGNQDPAVLDVLAAAQAANGQFDRAIVTAERAIAALGPSADAQTLATLRERLSLYRQRKPYIGASR